VARSRAFSSPHQYLISRRARSIPTQEKTVSLLYKVTMHYVACLVSCPLTHPPLSKPVTGILALDQQIRASKQANRATPFVQFVHGTRGDPVRVEGILHTTHPTSTELRAWSEVVLIHLVESSVDGRRTWQIMDDWRGGGEEKGKETVVRSRAEKRIFFDSTWT